MPLHGSFNCQREIARCRLIPAATDYPTPPENSPMAITLTENAADEIKRYQETENVEDGMMLRIAVAGGGCGGFVQGGGGGHAGAG